LTNEGEKMTKETHVVGLDLGTTNTTAVIVAIHPEGFPEVIGYGMAHSRGIRKGVVVNPEAAAEPIRQAVEEAEQMAGVLVDSAYVSLSGCSLRGLNNHGVVAITSNSHCITRNDIRRVIDSACIVTLPAGHEIIDVHPQQFIVDGQDGIDDPIDMLGTRLEVKAHIITGPMTIRQNIINAVNHAGLLVAGLVLESLATAEAVLLPDDREYGSATVSIGGEMTSLAIYQENAVQYTAIFPLGGSLFTNDIAFGLRTPMPEAERIKREHGCLLQPVYLVEKAQPIEVLSMGHRPPRSLSRQTLCEILQPRAEALFTHIRDEIYRAGFEKQLSSGVIFTGGGALLIGLVEMAEQILDCPTRLGFPLNVGGLAEETDTPLFATAIGLGLIAHRGGEPSYRMTQTHAGRLLSGSVSRVKKWLSNLF
jgi:cell division protein FtsA